MDKYKIYLKFSVVIEKEVMTVEAESEDNAIDQAFENEENIIDKLRNQYGDSVEFEKFSVIKEEE